MTLEASIKSSIDSKEYILVLGTGDELDADTKTTSGGGIIGDDLMNLFSKVRDYLNNSKENTVSTGSRHTAPDTTAIPEEFANSDRSSSDNNTEHKAPATPVPKTRIYSFESMDDFIDASKLITCGRRNRSIIIGIIINSFYI